ncbi:hypothetical protein LGL08_20410 [Clostridium estertheticum]|uniref:hypothetical protein n=1 Tax=Clostridium estertheticum TaxID=238834 RepID=UPI001CF3CC4F|nr:hypothetical protein [Clostridium estertheticum]MCB2308855.1 hypothetical protein [Clostridium estertheticum]MCB2347267.1 hypothetical protein [Clostridium estertheticum]MCB2351892.1 hypothetical protein [Clostridium estertheticum]WAG48470.1 hypothetical protein LL127_23395 [Clostridium estertheticum]
MNIKSVKLRITNKRLKAKLKECKRVAEIEAMETNNLTKKYEENVDRLSREVVKLTKENEGFKGKGIANKVKNIFKKR